MFIKSGYMASKSKHIKFDIKTGQVENSENSEISEISEIIFQDF